MRRACQLTLVAITVLAGCGGGAKTVPPSKLSKLVLQPADLHGPFTAFDVGRQTRLDLVAGPRSDPQRFGREGGWKARYNRPGSATTRGPLVVESRADVFKDDAGAAKDLAAYRAQFARQPGARAIRVERVGAATAATIQQGAGTRSISVAWQDGNVTASITVNGFAAGLRPADALALARSQERRITAAR
jgi:hypothetical protein